VCSLQSPFRKPATDRSIPVGLRDRGRIAVMTYAAARIGDVIPIPVDSHHLKQTLVGAPA